jgi:hypothetical protein
MSVWLTRLLSTMTLVSMGLAFAAPAMADGLIRLEPYQTGGSAAYSAAAPSTVPNFYSDPYTASLLNGGNKFSGATGGPVSPATTGYTPLQPLSGNGSSTSNYNPYMPQSNPPATAYGTSSGGYGSSAPLSGRVSFIPSGESFTVRMNELASSQTARVGDAISATLDSPIMVNGSEAVPAGSSVDGSVLYVSPASRVGKHGELEVRFMTITKPNGEKVAIDGGVVTTNGTTVLKGDTYKMDILKGVGIAGGTTLVGAVGGTAVGGLLGVAGTGAAIGTAVGGVAGVGLALARKGRGVDLPKGTRLKVKLAQPASVASSSLY